MWLRPVALALLIVSLGLVAAYVQSSTSGPDSQSEANRTLAKIFTPQMLNANLAYFEKFTGPAMTSFPVSKTRAELREYDLGDECIVWTDVANDKIWSMGVKLGPKCTVDLNKFRHYGGQLPTANQLTVGEFSGPTEAVKFASDCLTLCGNAADPLVFAYSQGSHADGFIDVAVGIGLVNDQALGAANKWKATMESARGEDYVIDLKFNCDEDFNEAALEAFRDVPITAVMVGVELEGPWTNCEETSESRTSSAMSGRPTDASGAADEFSNAFLERRVFLPYPGKMSAAVAPEPIGITMRQLVERLRSAEGTAIDFDQDGASGIIVRMSKLDQLTREHHKLDFELSPHPAISGLVVRRLIVDGTEIPPGQIAMAFLQIIPSR